MSKPALLTEKQQKLLDIIFNTKTKYPSPADAQIQANNIQAILNNPNPTRAQKKKVRLYNNANYSSMNPSMRVLMAHPSSGHKGIETLVKPVKMSICQEMRVALPFVLTDIIDDYEEKRMIPEIQHVEWCLHFDMWLLSLKRSDLWPNNRNTNWIREYLEKMKPYYKFTTRALEIMIDRYFNKGVWTLNAIITYQPQPGDQYIQSDGYRPIYERNLGSDILTYP